MSAAWKRSWPLKRRKTPRELPGITDERVVDERVADAE
jgi:hypothetical protein